MIKIKECKNCNVTNNITNVTPPTKEKTITPSSTEIWIGRIVLFASLVELIIG